MSNQSNKFAKLCLGGSTLGWSANVRNSIKILDYYYSNGGWIIDTSDFYSEWVPGNLGGESENIIGKWLSSNSHRDKLRIITKVGLSSRRLGFEKTNILKAAEDSLRRLRTDFIDTYMPHRDLSYSEQDKFSEAIITLYRAGKIRSAGFSHCSYETIERVSNILIDSQVPLTVIESNYNLLEREGSQRVIDLAKRLGMQFMSARGLAGGFLAGKYAAGSSQFERVLQGSFSHLFSRGVTAFRKGYRASMNSASVSAYLNPQNATKIEILDSLARKYETNPSSVVFSWLISQPGIDLTCISFRNVRQAKGIRKVEISEADLFQLSNL